ncbi:N-acetyltransferase [Rouxiella sp. S1S-2]|nr:N-acetyltransferase [Rouxiella sp. S1S-2]
MPPPTAACVIRPSARADLDEIMLLWLRSTLAAHPFIDESYWYESAAMVRESFLPQAKTWVACGLEHGEIIGFISVLNQQFIGALFVIEQVYGTGIAQRLMAEAKSHYSPLLLEVYQQNQRAVAFYRREGFGVIADTHHPGTGLATWVMSWKSATQAD